MKSILRVLALTLLAALPGKASLTINTEVVKKSIVFIYPAKADGTVDKTKPVGTGFFVVVPYTSGKGGYLLLLTARHILDPVWAGCPEANPSRVYLRLNLKKYDAESGASGVDFVPVDLNGTDQRTHAFQSDDAQIDGEVVALYAPTFTDGKYDFDAVPIAVFATDSEASLLDTGDEIISAGLMPGVQGELRNYPAFKFGAISTKMGEPLHSQCAPNAPVESEKAWVLSVNLFPGASGSPIFYTPPGSRGVQFGAPVSRPVLIGIQSSSLIPADLSVMTPIAPIFKVIENIHLQDADLFRGIKPQPAPPPPSPAPAPAPATNPPHN